MSEQAVYFPLIIELPWPAKQLSPNSRGSWKAKEPYRKAAKDSAFSLTRERYLPLEKPVREWQAEFIFHPPDHAHYDLDNALASCKAAQDGICAALGINDYHITRISVERRYIIPDGLVIVKIEPLAD